MIERGEYLSLVSEATEYEIGVHPTLDQLDGDLPAKLAVGALGQVDGAHAATSDFANDSINPDCAPDGGIVVGVAGESRRVRVDLTPQVRNCECWRFDEVAGPVVLRDKLLDLLAQSVIAGA